MDGKNRIERMGEADAVGLRDEPEQQLRRRRNSKVDLARRLQDVIRIRLCRLLGPGALRRIGKTWRTSVWVGLFRMTASASWFTAMTLQSTPLVRTLGQVELLFAFGVSLLVFRERVRTAEVAGSALIVVGIVLVLLLR